MKKLHYLFILLMVISCDKKASEESRLSCENCEEVIFSVEGLDVIPDHFARYPEGTKGIQEFISNNLKYPESAKVEGKQGRVVVSFVVDTTGNVADVKIIKGANQELDQEALRVVKLMNGWYPAIKDGKYINVEYQLPIRFSW